MKPRQKAGRAHKRSAMRRRPDEGSWRFAYAPYASREDPRSGWSRSMETLHQLPDQVASAGWGDYVGIGE